jgi:hypothetical protein
MRRLIPQVALLLMVPALTLAQDAGHPYRGQGYVVCGFGVGLPLRGISSTRIDQIGAGGEGFLYEGLGLGAEVGYASWRGYGNSAWVVSGDFSYHFGRHARRGRLDPFVLGGASFVGPTEAGGGRGSPAGNFGGGTNLWIADHAALRFEFRDVAEATQFWPYPHYLSFRFGVTFR